MKLEKIPIERIIEVLPNCKSLSDLFKFFNISTQTYHYKQMKEILNKNNLIIPKYPGNNFRNDVTKEILNDLYIDKKISIKDISKRLKSDPNFISKKLTEYGIVKRTMSEIVRKHDFNENYFNILNNESAWVIGLLASDGCIHNDTGISLSQSGTNGLKIMEYVKNILNFTGPVYTNTKVKKKSHNIRHAIVLNSSQTVSKLSEYNIVQRKSLIYEFPEKLIPWLYPFLRGYIDGDGSIGIHRNKVKNGISLHLDISFLGTKKFIDRCQELIPISAYKCQEKRNRNCWKLRWRGVNALTLGKLLYDDNELYTYYKKEKYLDFIKNLK